MDVLSGQQLLDQLNTACKKVSSRLWIASPYIGGWKSVRCILGRAWWDRDVQVKLLTDEDTKPNGDTLARFAQKGVVHHLTGLHAKIYIIDDRAILTSANLTGTAFSCRYEAGVMLSGEEAKSAARLYETWLEFGTSRLFDFSRLEMLVQKNRGNSGEDGTGLLTPLLRLPDDPGDFGGRLLDNRFIGYPAFREVYRQFASMYQSLPRAWPSLPIYFEIDGLFDFLYRIDQVSRTYADQMPRKLSQAERKDELRAASTRFRNWAVVNGEDGQWRLDHSKLVRRLLAKSNITNLGLEGIRQIVDGLSSMNDARRSSMFRERNATESIKDCWADLLHGATPLQERMAFCAASLKNFKEAGIQEMLGFYDPVFYPLRTKPVNAGLRFFGFEISGK